MNIIAALLIFTIIVVIHEFGHFLLAKKNGIEVTEFSIGMGLRLVTFAKTSEGIRCKVLCSQKQFESREDWKGITKYSWKLFPLGGSCAMVGEDTEDNSQGSFNEKGVWARFSVIFAGPFFNFLLAFIFSVIILGNAGIDLPNVVQVYSNQPGEAAGVQIDDTVKSINGKKIRIGREISTYLQLHPLTGEDVDLVVERNGADKNITISPDYETYLFGFSYSNMEGSSAEISQITEEGIFEKAGIKKGDVITGVNNTPIKDGEHLGIVMEEEKASGEPVEFTVERGDEDKSYTLTPELYEGKSLGFLASSNTMMGPLQTLKYSVIEVKYWIVTTVASLGQLIGGKLSMDDISGPVGIVDAVGGVVNQSAEFGVKALIINILYMSVLLSANLGVMNLLPLPALDGGRLVFILLEAVRGKPIDREKEGFVHLIGFFLLMAFMVFIMYNDVVKLFH